MSKRNRKKIKRIMRSQVEQKIKSDEQTETNDADSVSESQKPIKQTDLEIEDEKEVKAEIRKILLTMLVLILLIVGIYFINAKTDLILKMGEFIASKLNLSI